MNIVALSPTTHPSLLVRLRDCQNGQAWKEFGELYSPDKRRFGNWLRRVAFNRITDHLRARGAAPM
ncbi:MAG: hypothetical protein EXR99_05340 [Gemmataceae bacterium]|nr:hypothetical protein [Gemmataceae bacterium]